MLVWPFEYKTEERVRRVKLVLFDYGSVGSIRWTFVYVEDSHRGSEV